MSRSTEAFMHQDDATVARAAALRDQGLTYAEVGEAVGLPRAAVYQMLNRPSPPPQSCPVCGETFAPASRRQVYCSAGCREGPSPLEMVHVRIPVAVAAALDLGVPPSGVRVAALLGELAATKGATP